MQIVRLAVSYRVKKLKDDLDKLENQLSVAEHNLANADGQRQSALKEKSRLQKALTAAENQLAELRDELNEVNGDSICCSLETVLQVKEALSNETLAKVDLQNHIQSLQEEMAFKQRTHLQVSLLVLTPSIQEHYRK